MNTYVPAWKYPRHTQEINSISNAANRMSNDAKLKPNFVDPIFFDGLGKVTPPQP
jgi:hypothetical protein